MREGTEKDVSVSEQAPLPNGVENQTEVKIEIEEFQEVPTMGRSFLIHAVFPLLILWILSVYGNMVVKKDDPKPTIKNKPDTPNSYTSASLPEEDRDTAIEVCYKIRYLEDLSIYIMTLFSEILKLRSLFSSIYDFSLIQIYNNNL